MLAVYENNWTTSSLTISLFDRMLSLLLSEPERAMLPTDRSVDPTSISVLGTIA